MSMERVTHELSAAARSHGSERGAMPMPASSEREPRWPAYQGVTYYGRQAVKPSPFDWRIGAYLFASSLAGAAQIIATVARRIASPRLRSAVRNGRLVAFAGAVTGPLLLIGDLKTPQRWYNMLRIFRSTSAMSIGSYVLTAFGASSTLALVAEWTRGRRAHSALARAAELSAALSGAGMLTYTGALLSSTSTPVWAAESPLLSARFAASGMAAGAAALSALEQLAGRSANAVPLDALAFVSTGTYAALSRVSRQRLAAAGVDRPLREPPHRSLHRIGSTLLVSVPLACHALTLVSGRRSRAISLLASIATLAGAACTRYALLEAGKASAKRGADYLRFTAQPSEAAAPAHGDRSIEGAAS
jgi:formate-dependent nitrite reductase membrane component NrfD